MNGNTLTTDVVKKRLWKNKKIKLLSEYIGTKHEITCECHCGKIFIKKANNIMYRSNSCGCLMYQYDNGKNNYLWKGVGDISAHVWSGIKGNAKVRKLEFDVNMEYAWNLFLKQNKKCNYSGLKLKFNTNHNDRHMRTASLDRIDSSKGYVKGNVQWIHKKINLMKWNMSEEYFKKLCYLIINSIKNNSINKSCIIFKKHHSFKGVGNLSLTYWSDIFKKAKIRNIEFSINMKYVWNLFLKQKGYCALTGLPIEWGYKKKQTASLDRIDSLKGYVKGNVQWVYKDINNKLKRELNEIELKKYCRMILDHTRGNKYEN